MKSKRRQASQKFFYREHIGFSNQPHGQYEDIGKKRIKACLLPFCCKISSLNYGCGPVIATGNHWCRTTEANADIIHSPFSSNWQ